VSHATTIITPGHRAPLVVTLHDLAWRHEGGALHAARCALFRTQLELVRQEARLVLCSSRTTMADCSAAGIEQSRLRHVPLRRRVSLAAQASGSSQARYVCPTAFVFVRRQALEPRKNLAGLVAADGSASRSRTRGGRTAVGVRYPTSPGERARVLGFVGGQELSGLLLRRRPVFCYPSFWEGFRIADP